MALARFDRTQILLEPSQRRQLAEIASQENRSLSEIVREMIDVQLAERRRQAMAAAAQALLSDYQTDSELTAFTALDGEEVKSNEARRNLAHQPGPHHWSRDQENPSGSHRQ